MARGGGEYGAGGENTLSWGLEGGVSSTDLIRESLLLHFFNGVQGSESTDGCFLAAADFVLFLLRLFSLMQASGLASMNSGARVQ